MQELWKLLASPRHIVFFEAAARHRSFTKAASELNVQQPAVSAAMKQLESSLGVPLFARAHKRVSLTLAGEKLFADVSSGLGTIKNSAIELRNRAMQDHVTLSASTAFAHYWMVPRLGEFHAMHPDIELRLQTSDREPPMQSEGISLAIRRGHGDWPDAHAAKIADEIIYPIASSSQSELLKNVKSVRDLHAQALIHLEEPIRDRPTWDDFFAAQNFLEPVPDTGLRLNDYALVLQAAISGQGISFGWNHVVAPMVEKGVLVARKDMAWATGFGFYLVWSKQGALPRNAAMTRDWIIDTAKTGQR